MSKSNIQRSICLSFVLFINLINDDSAQAEGAQLGGKIWAKMSTDLMEDKPNPAFDVYRGFVTGSYTFAENWSSSIIVEAATTKAVLTSIHAGENISLFQAMIQGKKLLTDSDTFRVGLAPGQYLVPLYKKLGTRYLGRTLSHYQGNMGTRQLGVSYLASISDLRFGIQLHQGAKTHGKKTEHDRAATLTLGYDLTKELGMMVSHEYSQTIDNRTPDQNSTAFAFYFANPKYRAALEASHSLSKGSDKHILGLGLTTNIEIIDQWRLYGRLFSGNEDFKSVVKSGFVWSIGPSFTITKGISTAVVLDNKESFDNSDPVRVVSLVLAANK